MMKQMMSKELYKSFIHLSHHSKEQKFIQSKVDMSTDGKYSNSELTINYDEFKNDNFKVLMLLKDSVGFKIHIILIDCQ